MTQTFGLDPYWYLHSYDQQQPNFYHNYDKPTQDIEPNSSEFDPVLDMTLANACVDPWQHKYPVTHQLTSPEPENEIHREGTQVSLATAVAARLMNTLVTRTGHYLAQSQKLIHVKSF